MKHRTHHKLCFALLSIFVKVWNVNVNFCVHINECWLTENEYLDLLQFRCLLQFSIKVRGVFYAPPCIYHAASRVVKHVIMTLLTGYGLNPPPCIRRWISMVEVDPSGCDRARHPSWSNVLLYSQRPVASPMTVWRGVSCLLTKKTRVPVRPLVDG